MTTTLTEPIVSTVPHSQIETSDGSGPATHIVLPPDEDKEHPQAYVVRARIEGFPVTALCGYTWVPQRDPKQYPVCTKCIAVYEDSPNPDRMDLPDA